MGIGSSFKRTIGKVVSQVPGLEQTAESGLLGLTGLGLESALDTRSRELVAAGGSPLSQEQITTANLFSRLSPEQQKDLLLNNPNIVTAQGEQIYDPLTNTIRLKESSFQKEQRGRQEALAASLTGQLQGQQLPGTDPQSRFEEGRRMLEPAFTEERQKLEQQLEDQGLPRGSEAFNKELNRLEQSQGRRLQEVARESVATSEAQRQARFNEIASLLGQQQTGGVGFGGFQAQFSGLDLFGAEQAGLNRSFQADQAQRDRRAAQRAALMGALGQAGGAAIAAFSDRRLKDNIEIIGISDMGIPIIEFEYIDKKYGSGRYKGALAQDVENIVPNAVINDKETGFKKVIYELTDIEFKKII
jgi:hypothetical protein